MKFCYNKKHTGHPSDRVKRRQGQKWFELFSCLCGCFKPSQDSVDGEVDISTPFSPHPVHSIISDSSTDDHQVPRFRKAQEFFNQSATARHDQPNDIHQQHSPTVNSHVPTWTSVQSRGSSQEAEVQDAVDKSTEISDDEDSDWVDVKDLATVCTQGSDHGCIADIDVALPCLDLVPYNAENSICAQIGPVEERISRDSDEVEELEKVNRWQQGRAVLGRNNLLKHRCDPGAPRRRGIFDYYNQRNALFIHPEEMTAIVFSGPDN